MASMNNIKEGQVLWDYHRYKTNAGAKEGCWPVVVEKILIQEETGIKYAICSWNGNPSREYLERDIKRLRVNKKETK